MLATFTNIYVHTYEIYIYIYFSVKIRLTLYDKYVFKNLIFILFSSVKVNYGSDAVPGDQHELTRLLGKMAQESLATKQT